MTGIRWLASFTQHQPARLTSVSFDELSGWTFPLLSIIDDSATARNQNLHLSLQNESFSSKVIRDEVSRSPPLRSVSHLTVTELKSEVTLNELLALTPSLQELRLQLIHYFRSEQTADLKHRLPCLTKLIVYVMVGLEGKIRPAWLASFRRNGSPTGLEMRQVARKVLFGTLHDFQL